MQDGSDLFATLHANAQCCHVSCEVVEEIVEVFYVSFFCSILCPRSPEKTESCGELKNKVLLLVPQIAEGFWSCTSDAALLQDPLRFEVHQEIVHGHSFSFQWKTSEFSSAVLQLESVVTVHLCMLKSLRQSLQRKRRSYCEMSEIAIRFYFAFMSEAHGPSAKGWTWSQSNGISLL